jgi:hypothetical protein
LKDMLVLFNLKASTEEYRYLSIHVLEAPWKSTSLEHMAWFQRPRVLGLLLEWHQISEWGLQKIEKGLRLQGWVPAGFAPLGCDLKRPGGSFK